MMVLVKTLYGISAIWLALYGLNSLLLALIFLGVRKRSHPTPQPPTEWPMVTVQLPIYNEMHVAERLIAAAAALDYPRDRLQIQVLDDSTDDTRILVRQAVGRYAHEGMDIQCIHREDRSGFKAGALAAGLGSAKGEFIAIFDADFVPPTDFLRHLVPYFASPKVGCVQARWEHLNRNYSLLTQLQSIGIDSHFAVEQRARSEGGFFLNFNGSAGMWRRTCIHDAGGWQADTLAEDLDLSYRAQLKGWRILFVPDVSAPAELPPQMDALRRQQSRWAQGSIRVAIKLLPTLLCSKQPWWIKAEGVLHLTGYLVHPLILAILLLTAPTMIAGQQVSVLMPFFLIAAVGPPLLCFVAQVDRSPDWWKQLRFGVPVLMLGMGLALNNTLAIVRAVLGRKAEFQRTPKFDIQQQNGQWQSSVYALRCSPLVWGELALAALSMVTALIEWCDTGLLPYWLAIYSLSYVYVAGTSLLQSWETWRRSGGALLAGHHYHVRHAEAHGTGGKPRLG